MVDLDTYRFPAYSENLSREPAPYQTPWGESESRLQYIPILPIWLVSNDAHGGYMVEDQWARKNLSRSALTEGFTFLDPATLMVYRCYEEDCAWAVLEWEVPALRLFHADTNVSDNHQGVDRWTTYIRNMLSTAYPEYLAAVPDRVPVPAHLDRTILWASAQIDLCLLHRLVVRYIESAPAGERWAYITPAPGRSTIEWTEEIVTRYTPIRAAEQSGVYEQLLVAWAKASRSRRTALAAVKGNIG